jgi:DNA helicase-2/ATP-dependent DNA helicase PcrA
MSAAVDIRRLLGVSLSDQQRNAITAPLEPAVIVAGAGTGKTTVMAARVVWLVATGQVRPEQVLGLTFTNKAAAELGQRVRAALASLRSETPGEPTIATYHAFAGRLVSEHGLRLGIEPDLRLLADASRFQLAATAVRQAKGCYRHLSTHLPTLVTDLLTLDEQMAEHLVEPAEIRGFAEDLRRRLTAAPASKRLAEVLAATDRRDELVELVEGYRRLKRAKGVLDFADQMALGAHIAERCPPAADAERERYAVVLLDEYQDTSVAQRRMLTGLFSGGDPTAGRGHSVMAVGDPCQAIYGWRGASLANLEEFADHFPRATGEPARHYALSVNRRSGRRILDAANAHAEQLYAVHAGTQPLTCPDGAAPGRIHVALHSTYAEEIAWVAGEVARLHDRTPGLRWSDIAVLVHDNADAAALQEGLAADAVPVEVVGLGGLLATPEVSEVLAVLEVLHELTANAALLRVLTGPRWRIGPRDLALLGRRARALADRPLGEAGAGGAAALQRAISGVDPTETVCLADALERPGVLSYSAAARERFGRLREEIRWLRRYLGEPLVDLVRRVISTTGLDIELSVSGADRARTGSDNLAAFVDAVAAFAGADDDATLGALLSYLRAEDDYAGGLAVATPSQADSVKLLTVHKAKGLEWEVVFLPMLAEGVFPSGRGRSRWVSSAKELPWPLRGDAATLPVVQTWSAKGLDAFRAQAIEHEQREERRLGYVALTRARRHVVASGHWWGPTQSRRRGPSAYLRTLAAGAAGEVPNVACWAAEPPNTATNPALDVVREVPWPAPGDPVTAQRQREAAELVAAARTRVHDGEAQPPQVDDGLDTAECATVSRWDLELAQLLEEAHAASDPVREVELPGTLSTTRLMALQADPQRFAADLARPMPRKPSPAARFGTRFHAWVEAYAGQQRLLEADDIPGAADAGIGSDAALRSLCDAFRAGPYGARRPHQVEAPFSLVLAGQVVRGRIDAVYRDAQGWEVVDWKTNVGESADPLQLAVYRLAWAELRDVPVEEVRAAFYYVRTGVVDRPVSLPGRAELEALLVSV